MKYFISLNIHAEAPYALNKYIGYQEVSSAHQAFIASISAVTKPSSYFQAMKDPRWITAMQEQIKALEDNKTWEIVFLPPNKKPMVICGSTKSNIRHQER